MRHARHRIGLQLRPHEVVHAHGEPIGRVLSPLQFGRDEEVQPVAHDGTAGVEAREHVLQFSRRPRAATDHRVADERVVAEEPERGCMEVVGAGPRHGVENAPREPRVTDVVRGREHLEFLDRRERDHPPPRLSSGHAGRREAEHVLAEGAVHLDVVETDVRPRDRGAHVVHRHQRREPGESRDVPRDRGHGLYDLAVDDRRRAHPGGVELGVRLDADGDFREGDRRFGEPDFETEPLSGAERQVFARHGAEADARDLERPGAAGPKVAQAETARLVADGGVGRARFNVTKLDAGSRDRTPVRVEDESGRAGRRYTLAGDPRWEEGQREGQSDQHEAAKTICRDPFAHVRRLPIGSPILARPHVP